MTPVTTAPELQARINEEVNKLRKQFMNAETEYAAVEAEQKAAREAKQISKVKKLEVQLSNLAALMMDIDGQLRGYASVMPAVAPKAEPTSEDEQAERAAIQVVEGNESALATVADYKAGKIDQAAAIAHISSTLADDTTKGLCLHQVKSNKVIRDGKNVISIGQPEAAKPLAPATKAVPAPVAAPTTTTISFEGVDYVVPNDKLKQFLDQFAPVVEAPKQQPVVEPPVTKPVVPAKPATDTKRTVALSTWQEIGKAVGQDNRKFLQASLKPVKEQLKGCNLAAGTEKIRAAAIVLLEAQGFKAGVDFQVYQAPTKAKKETAHKAVTPQAVKAKAMTAKEMKTIVKDNNLKFDFTAYNMKSSIDRAKATAALEALLAA